MPNAEYMEFKITVPRAKRLLEHLSKDVAKHPLSTSPPAWLRRIIGDLKDQINNRTENADAKESE